MSVLTFPVEAGTRGLRRDLLHHLVESRYAAAMAGGSAWAARDLGQLAEAAGHVSAPTTEHLREALSALEGLGLVVVARSTDGAVRWSATNAGVRCLDQAPLDDHASEYAERLAA